VQGPYGCKLGLGRERLKTEAALAIVEKSAGAEFVSVALFSLLHQLVLKKFGLVGFGKFFVAHKLTLYGPQLTYQLVFGSKEVLLAADVVVDEGVGFAVSVKIIDIERYRFFGTGLVLGVKPQIACQEIGQAIAVDVGYLQHIPPA